jgi:nucleotide-binding universal stress UspA family protein
MLMFTRPEPTPPTSAATPSIPIRQPERQPEPRGAGRRRTILVGVDGTRTSLRAASYAAGLADRQRSRLVGLLVVPPVRLTSYAPELAPLALLDTDECQHQLAAQLCQGAGWDLGTAEVLVRIGDPCTSVAQVAEELRADLVIVGAARSWLHRLGGSLGARLIRRTRCPVTVVP